MAGLLGRAAIPMFGCACLIVVLILQIVSFAAPHWVSLNDQTHFGLWKYSKCVPNFKTGGCYNMIKTAHVGDWLHAVRGLESLAIIFWVIPVMVVPVYLYVSLGLYYRCWMLFMTIFTLLGTVANIIGVIIFGTKINDESTWDLDWCLILAAIAGVIGFFTIIIFIVACLKRPVFGMQTHLTSGFYVEPDRNRMYVIENNEKPGPLEGGQINPAMSE